MTVTKSLITWIIAVVATVALLGRSPTAEAADKGSILLESGRISSAHRADTDMKLDGMASRVAADLTASLQKLGLSRSDKAYYIIRVKGPRVARIKTQIQKAGAEVMAYVQYYAFIVKMDGDTMERVVDLDEVEWVGPYKAEQRIASRLKERMRVIEEGVPEGEVELEGAASLQSEDTIRLNIYLFSNDGVSTVSDLISIHNGTVEAEVRNEGIHKVRATVPLSMLDQLSGLPEVRMIYEHIPLKNLNDVGAGIMGVPEVWNTHGLSGTNQIVGHTDSGLDVGATGSVLNADFRGKVVAAYAYGRTNDWSDLDGHGTHTAGSILGNGSNSTGNYRGIAYAARIVHQSGKDANGTYTNLPDWGTLFGQTFSDGARIHSLSLGANSGGQYGESSEVDTWSWNSGSPNNMLVVIAAGNAGSSGNTVGTPGTAKNCLTVGASENNRPACGSDGDNTNEIASFSSRGPTDEGRIKPDIVAPGTWIASVRTHGSIDTFYDDFESGTNGWDTTNPLWTQTSSKSRSVSTCWAYTNDSSASDYLRSPYMTIPQTNCYVRFRWKGTLKGYYNSYIAKLTLYYRFESNSGYYAYNGSVARSPYSRDAMTYTNWQDYSWEILPSMWGSNVQFCLQADLGYNLSYMDVYVDDFQVTTFINTDDMWAQGLATEGDSIDTNYTLMSGTSMATPLTAGAAALVRQFYQEEKTHTPSAALMKATLISGATDMTPATPRPDNNEGWGRINLEYSIFPPAPRTFLYYDVTNGLSEGESFVVNFEVTNSTEELRATLVWTDPSGATLQNDLDLILAMSEASVTNRSDSVNNVEGIDVSSPTVGVWGAEVAATTISDGPQPFALIIAGAVGESSAPEAPSGFQASPVSASRIDLQWNKNSSNDNVMVAYNTNDVFVAPSNGTSYSAGSMIGSAEVLCNGSSTNYNHTNLNAETTYYYRAWSINAGDEYSPAAGANAETFMLAPTVPFLDGFESGTLSNYWSTYSTGNGRVLLTTAYSPKNGSYHVTMDTSSSYALNELILTIDLAGQTDVWLDFWWKDFGDENSLMSSSFVGHQNADGVAISEDGTNWYEAVELLPQNIPNQTYTNLVVDLDAVLASNGLSYNANFKVKFQQYDNYAITSEGFAFDDIAVYAQSGVSSGLLTIASAHGTPSPAVGVYTNELGSVLTNSVTTPDPQGTTQYVCIGWSMAGNDPASGATNMMVMTHTNNVTLTWTWSTNVQFTRSAGANGSVTGDSDGWYALGGSVTVTAVPNVYYHFTEWSGDVPGGQIADNPLALTMGQARSIASIFAENLATHGTPEWWLAQYGLTNDGSTFAEAETNDVDGDTMSAHDERIADTNPTNAASLFGLMNPDVTNSCIVTFGCTNSRVYSLQTREDMVNSSWAMVAGQTNVPGDDGGTMSLTDTNDVVKGLYRVRVALP